MSDDTLIDAYPTPRPLYAYTGPLGVIARNSTYNQLAKNPPIRHLDSWIVSFCEGRREHLQTLHNAGLSSLLNPQVFERRMKCPPAGVQLADSPIRCRWSLCAHCHVANVIKLWTDLDAYLFPGGCELHPDVRMVVARSEFRVRSPEELRTALSDQLEPLGRGRAMERRKPLAAISAISAQAENRKVWAEERRLMLFDAASIPYVRMIEREEFRVIDRLTRRAFLKYFSKVYLYSTLMMRGRPDLAVAFADLVSTSRLLQRFGNFRAIPGVPARRTPQTALPDEASRSGRVPRAIAKSSSRRAPTMNLGSSSGSSSRRTSNAVTSLSSNRPDSSRSLAQTDDECRSSAATPSVPPAEGANPEVALRMSTRDVEHPNLTDPDLARDHRVPVDPGDFALPGFAEIRKTFSSGSDVFDRAIGGLAGGEVYGFIAPIGAGKTTVGTQLALKQA